MIRVGLTGGIACGKTTVGDMFVALGCRRLDADAVTHDLLAHDPDVFRAVVGEFGPGILDAEGRIDRRRLGAVVFADAGRRAALTGILHPEIFRRQETFLAECAREDPSGIAIVDAALMVETGSYRRYDCLVVVTCRPDQQRARLAARGLEPAAIEARIAAQMPLEEKARHADFVIDNSGPVEATHRQVEAVHAELRARAGRAR